MRYLIWCVHHDVNEQEYADYEEKLEELEMRELKKEQDARWSAETEAATASLAADLDHFVAKETFDHFQFIRISTES